MKKYGKLIAGLLAGTMILSGLTGCGSKESNNGGAVAVSAAVPEDDASQAEENENVDVRISFWEYNIQGTLFDYANELGLLEKEFPKDGNVTITLIPFENGPTANEAITAGDLDFELSIGDQPFITGNANGVDTAILATTMKQEKTYITVVAGDSDINSYADLKGKNIAVGIGTFSHKSLIGILKDNGIGESEVSFTNIGDNGYSEALTAIDRGEIDAYFSSWANLNSSLEDGSVKKIGDSTGHPLTTYFVGTNSFIANHPEITEKLVKVLYDTVAYINEKPEEATAYFAKRLDWDEETVSNLIENVDIVIDLTEQDAASIKETQDFLVTQDILEEEVDELIEKHTNSSFVEKVKGN